MNQYATHSTSYFKFNAQTVLTSNKPFSVAREERRSIQRDKAINDDEIAAYKHVSLQENAA